MPGWTPPGNEFQRLAAAPKHHLADPAIAARLLNATEHTLLHDGSPNPGLTRHASLLGGLFESLVTQSVRVYAQAAEATVAHLRDSDSQREIDLIVEGHDGQVVAFEVKLAATVSDADVKHLHWLATRLGDRLADYAVITTGSDAYRRKDGIAVIPAGLLGP